MRSGTGQHLVDGSIGVGKEVQGEQRGNAAVAIGPARKVVNSRHDKRGSGVSRVLAGVLDEGLSGVASHYRGRIGVTADRVRERARAAPHIEPVNAAGYLQPEHEPGRELAVQRPMKSS